MQVSTLRAGVPARGAGVPLRAEAHTPSPFALHLLADRFPPLHGLRALAIVSVLQIHVTVALSAAGLLVPDALYVRSTTVWFGMDLFFILSGFLIGTMLLPRDDRSAPPAMWRFYARRAFRIVPLYYVVLAMLALSRDLSPEQWSGLVYEFAYLTNYPVLSAPAVMPWAWSLALEEHFYLVVPLVAGLLRFVPGVRARMGVLVGLWLLGLGVRLSIFLAHTTPWAPGEMMTALYVPTHARFDILVAGVLLAHVQHHDGARLRRALGGRAVRVAIAAIPAACAWLLLGPLAHRYDVTTVLAWGTITSVMYFALAILVLNTDSAVSRWLSSRWFLRFATLGYGVYLVHPPVLAWVIVPVASSLRHDAHTSSTLVWLVSLLLVVIVATAVAYALHLAVEKPALWLRDRVAR